MPELALKGMNVRSAATTSPSFGAVRTGPVPSLLDAQRGLQAQLPGDLQLLEQECG
jgi:hypothetical protein